ncbi:MAG: hypothetical protein QNJ00_14135 [Woeseiaceae bacterium]|nr:hypothetical protein [Woeseiaceae bacterium]
MKAFFVKIGVLALTLAASTQASADSNFGIGVKAGTLGLGLEGTWRPLPYMDLRVGANLYDYSDDGSQAGIDYEAELNLDTFYATGNFRFPMSPFRVTAGLFQNGNELNMASVDSATFEIGGQTYTAAEVGTLRSTSSFSSTSPYLGVGYDFTVMGKVGLNLDFGVLWQGEPTVTLTADGLLANDPTFLAAVEAERVELEDEVSNYKAWPVVSLGFVFNF